MGLKLYLDHVLAQAANIISHQAISTLFTTPPLLVALAGVMSSSQKEQILGIHTGGMNLEPQTALELQEHFPHAVILPGYGNSLFGVTFPRIKEGRGNEGKTARITDEVFEVQDPALWLQLAPIPENEQAAQDLVSCVAPGQRGRVILHRLDPSFLILNLAERDTALAVAAPNGEMGLARIAPLQFATPLDRQGVY
jgi:hypothetical protein